MYKNCEGGLEIITFRSDRSAHPYWFPIQALIDGYSTGHVAMRINFYDPRLFAKYIHGNPNIPYATSFDSISKKIVYHVYLSFWPLDSKKNKHSAKQSTLIDYIDDCERSQNNSPTTYIERFHQYLQPIHRLVYSRIPILNNLFLSHSYLPPSIMLHLTRLENAHGMCVSQAAQSYVEYYLKWRKAVIRQLNLESLGINTRLIEAHKKFCDKKLIRLLYQEQILQETMFPDEKLNRNTFFQRVQEFMSFGYPERDSIKLPLTDNYGVGIQLEPVLAYIKQIADNPKQFPYGLLGINCAYIIYQALYEGLKNTRFQSLQDALSLPWYARLLGITLTPGLIFDLSLKLAASIDALKYAIPIDRKEPSPPLLTRIEEHKSILAFSQSEELDEETSAPSRILVIQNLCKFLESKLSIR